MSETPLKISLTDSLFSSLYEAEGDYWWSAARRSLVTRFLQRYCEFKNPRLIDVGCGGGGFLKSLAGYDNLFGVESSSSAAIHALKKSSAKIVQGDAAGLPFKDRRFDILTSLDVIEHLESDGDALKEYHRILTDGGVVILTVPAFEFLWSPRDIILAHKRRYTIRRIKRLLTKAGFKVMKCSYTNLFYFPGLFIYSLFSTIIKRKRDLGKTIFVLTLPEWLSTFFNWILKVEEFILMHGSLPIGTSIICIAKKETEPN